MKKILCCSLLILPLFACCQTVTWKSNDIQLQFNEEAPSGAVPFIRWIYPALDFTSTEQGKVRIAANITSESPLSLVQLQVLDTKSNKGYAHKEFKEIKDNKFEIETQVALLQDGTYAIEIIATNQVGTTVTARRDIIVGKDALDFISADRKDYALIFATDNYDHWDDLVNPVNDGNTIARELKEKYNFETEVVENANVEEVFEKLRDYNERKFKPQDQLLVFFAGHGLYDDTFGEGYVVAKNSLGNDKGRTSYIAHARLRGVVNNIPCHHILLVMDVCFGGTLDPVIARSRAVGDELTERQMLARKLSYKTRKYLTSGGKEYVPDGAPGRHSPFAAKLIESLRSAGGDDKILTLAEVQQFMEKLKLVPRFGAFGEDEALSDFVFVAKTQ